MSISVLGADSDGDGVDDSIDNCPNTFNPDQDNFDGDSEGDACDGDDDNDGSADFLDCEPLNPNVNEFANEICTNGIDDDCDTLADNDDPSCDLDQDGTQNTEDNCPAISNSNQEDSDNDGIGNACDNCPEDFNPGQEDDGVAINYFDDLEDGDLDGETAIPGLSTGTVVDDGSGNNVYRIENDFPFKTKGALFDGTFFNGEVSFDVSNVYTTYTQWVVGLRAASDFSVLDPITFKFTTSDFQFAYLRIVGPTGRQAIVPIALQNGEPVPFNLKFVLLRQNLDIYVDNVFILSDTLTVTEAGMPGVAATVDPPCCGDGFLINFDNFVVNAQSPGDGIGDACPPPTIFDLLFGQAISQNLLIQKELFLSHIIKEESFQFDFKAIEIAWQDAFVSNFVGDPNINCKNLPPLFLISKEDYRYGKIEETDFFLDKLQIFLKLPVDSIFIQAKKKAEAVEETNALLAARLKCCAYNSLKHVVILKEDGTCEPPPRVPPPPPGGGSPGVGEPSCCNPVRQQLDPETGKFIQVLWHCCQNAFGESGGYQQWLQCCVSPEADACSKTKQCTIMKCPSGYALDTFGNRCLRIIEKPSEQSPAAPSAGKAASTEQLTVPEKESPPKSSKAVVSREIKQPAPKWPIVTLIIIVVVIAGAALVIILRSFRRPQ